MEITKEILKKAMPNCSKCIYSNKNFRGSTVDAFVVLMNRYSAEFGITTAKRWAHFLAQIAHESGEMLYSEEQGAKAYFDKYGQGNLARQLGNTCLSDGYKYRGRGLIQLTGKANYSKYKDYCGFDVVTNPDLLMYPVGAIRSAMWFWKTRGLNELADEDNITAITKKINGGYNGLDRRKKFLAKAKKALHLA